MADDRIPNNETIIQYLEQKYPGYIKCLSPQYSAELSKFNEQWALMCVSMNCTPKSVVLLYDAHIPEHRTTHLLLSQIIKVMIMNGYSVVDCNNFDVCSVCNEIIVNRQRVEAGGLIFTGRCTIHKN